MSKKLNSIRLGPEMWNELGLSKELVGSWFIDSGTSQVSVYRIDEETVEQLRSTLVGPLRRFYISDSELEKKATAGEYSSDEIIAAYLPDPGSVMSGDFGEFVSLLLQASMLQENTFFTPIKWRLKTDRTKAAPHSDIVHFVAPNWPRSSLMDEIICAEVKTKATSKKTSNPVESAVTDLVNTDKNGERITRTLAWLKECQIKGVVDGLPARIVDRFLKDAIDEPPYETKFNAFAVLCKSVESEGISAPSEASDCDSVSAIIVPRLKTLYTDIFNTIANKNTEEES